MGERVRDTVSERERRVRNPSNQARNWPCRPSQDRSSTTSALNRFAADRGANPWRISWSGQMQTSSRSKLGTSVIW